MSRRTWRMMVVAVLALALGAWGCGGSGGGDSSSTGSSPALRIAVTDAPFPFSSVTSATVELQRIDIRSVGGGFETLKTFPGGKPLDLVQLRNGITEVVFEGDPGPGEYDALRLVVVPKEVVIDEDGAPRHFTDFVVPSGPQTGIKVFIDPTISVVTGLTMDLVLDFDLSRSFIVQGNPNTPAGIKGFHFKPVIRAVNASTAGSLTFRVLSNNDTPEAGDDFCLDGAEYTVLDLTTDPATVVASGATGPNPADATVCGYAFHPAIPAGSYELEVEAPGHDAYTAPVSIVAANLTDLGTITLEASGNVILGTVTTTLTTSPDADPASEILELGMNEVEVTATPTGEAVVEAADTTNTLGAYMLSPLLGASYDVRVSPPAGYAGTPPVEQAGVAPWVYGAPGATLVDFVLVPLVGDVTGTVTDNASPTPNPVAGAHVRATVDYAGAPKLIAATVTDADGTYTLVDVPTGMYVVTASDAAETTSVSAPLEHVGGGAPSEVPALVLP